MTLHPLQRRNHYSFTFPQESPVQLHTVESDLNSLSILQLTRDQEQILHFITHCPLRSRNVEFKLNTKEGQSRIEFKGQLI